VRADDLHELSCLVSADNDQADRFGRRPEESHETGRDGHGRDVDVGVEVVPHRTTTQQLLAGAHPGLGRTHADRENGPSTQLRLRDRRGQHVLVLFPVIDLDNDRPAGNRRLGA